MARAVLISNSQKHLELDEASVRGMAELVLESEGAPAGVEVSIAVVDDAAIAALNARHLGRDAPTDVIAFPMDEAAGPEAGLPEPARRGGAMLLGDVVVSAERAICYSREHGGDALAELSLYLVHGLLHLLGYDDLDEPERARMQQREGELLGRAAAAGVVLRGRAVHTDE